MNQNLQKGKDQKQWDESAFSLAQYLKIMNFT